MNQEASRDGALDDELREERRDRDRQLDVRLIVSDTLRRNRFKKPLLRDAEAGMAGGLRELAVAVLCFFFRFQPHLKPSLRPRNVRLLPKPSMRSMVFTFGSPTRFFFRSTSMTFNTTLRNRSNA